MDVAEVKAALRRFGGKNFVFFARDLRIDQVSEVVLVTEDSHLIGCRLLPQKCSERFNPVKWRRFVHDRGFKR